MSLLNRRNFIKSTLATAATITVAGTKSSGQVIGANDTINIGVAGINGRGRHHIDQFAGMNNVRVSWLIDPDSRLFESRGRQATRGGNRPQTTQDVRRALEDRNLDALSIATPNHWHSLMAIWACQARKDVYVEKPCSHNVHEGRVLVETARREQRIVQHGTQSRSSSSWARVAEVIRSGQLGRLRVARALCYKTRNSIGREPMGNPPAGVDFNLWLGPAQQQRYHANLVHYDWHWFWDFGNGDIGNQGVHQMDIARWGIPDGTYPRSVISLGGRFGYSDQGQTPNTQISIMDYGQTQLIFEVRGLVDRRRREDSYRGVHVGNTFHFENGDTIIGTDYYPRGRETAAPLPRVNNVQRGPGNGHFGNFIAAMRSRRRQDLNAEILEGHLSSALCHLANISYRLGENVPFDPRTRALQGNAAGTETLERMEAHLREKGVRLQGTTVCVGPRLQFDARQEQFTGNARANELLTRNYRTGFTLPRASS